MVVIAGGALLSSASAADMTWTGGAGAADRKFSSAGNWSLNRAPAASDTLIFSGTDGATLELTNDLTVDVARLYFNGTTAYTIAGGTTVFKGDGNKGFYHYGSQPLTVQGDIQANTMLVFSNQSASNYYSNITVTGTIFTTARVTNWMVGGTLALGGINSGENDVLIAGPNYVATHPLAIGQPLPVTVVGDITGKSFFNAYGGEVQYGEIRLTGSNNLTGDTVLANANLVLDYTAATGADARKLGSGNLVFYNSGRLTLDGGTTQETVNGMFLGHGNYQFGGGVTVIERASGSATINVSGGIQRTSFNSGGLNGTVNATLSLSEDGIIYTTNTSSGTGYANDNFNGIIRPWVTVGGEGDAGRDWAFKDTDNYIKAFKAYDTTNVLFAGGTNMTENTTINSLKLDSSSGDAPQDTLNLANYTLTVQSGGLMFVGAKDYVIASGTLRMGQDNIDEFLVWQSGLGELTISADLVARSITKVGEGTLTLSGQFLPQDIPTATSGGIALEAGVLKLGANWGDATAHMLLMQYSGTLDMNGHDLLVKGVGGNAALTALTPSRITNDAEAMSTLYIAPFNGASDTTISGLTVATISGNLHLDISGGASTNLALTAWLANTHTGGVTIHDNIAGMYGMKIQNAGWFGTGTLTLGGNAGFYIEDASADTPGWDNFTNAMQIIGDNNRIANTSNRALNFNNTWSGSGELIVEVTSNQVVGINADLSDFSGTLRLRSGVDNTSRVLMGSSYFSSTNTVTDWSTVDVVLDKVTSTSYVRSWLQSEVVNQTYKLGNLSVINNAADGPEGNNQFILRSNVASGTTTFEIGYLNLSGTFDGHISNWGNSNGGYTGGGFNFVDNNPTSYITALTKVGSGTLTLTNLNTYSGTTTVSGGVLLISGTGVLTRTAGVNVSTGGAFIYDSAVALDRAVNVSEGGLFGGSGNVSGINLTLAQNAELTGGGVLSTGTLTLTQALTLDDFTYQWDIAADDDYDLLNFTSLTLSGDNYTVNVNAINGLGVLSDDKNWTILSGLQAGNLGLWSLNQDAADAGFTLNLQGTNLLLNYSAVPEPSTWALIVTGVALLAVLRSKKFAPRRHQGTKVC
jgi:autotransporter-associated beta strand protein